MRITYLFDPLCGWCYGAGPAVEKLSKLANLQFELAPTGLFAGASARPMDERFSDYAWRNDQRIAALTGQPFSEAYRSRVLGAKGARFDSAPATLGVVAAGLSDPLEGLAALRALQRARYVEGRDTSDREAVADVLGEIGFDSASHRIRTPDDDVLAACRRRIESARSDMAAFGLEGVPALLIGEGPQRRLVRGDALYGHFDRLAAELDAA